MFCVAKERAFRILQGRRRLKVLQPDERGVVRELLDESSGDQYFIKARKIRNALSGKQNLMLCKAGTNSDGNAFFTAINEIIALDRFNGNYVILSPKIAIANTEFGATYFSSA